MFKNVLIVLVMIVLFGLIGRMDYQDEVKTAEYDRQNKAEVIKDLQLRCFKGELDNNYCKEWGM